MSEQQTSLPPGEGNNPFATGNVLAQPGKGSVPQAPARGPDAARTLRVLRLQMLAVLLLVASLVGAGCWYILRAWQAAEKRLQNTQYWTANVGTIAILNASNSMVQARQAERQARYSAEQARRDQELVVGMKVETATTLTNAAIELSRLLSRQLTEKAQSNIMALDLSYATRVRDLEEQVEKQRQALQKSAMENLKTLSRELGKYDALLKLDPDIAGRIDTALKQLKQLVDITELLKLRQEEDVKNLQNQMAILTEKLKVLDLRQSNLQLSVSNAIVPSPAAVPVPVRGVPVTNAVPPK